MKSDVVTIRPWERGDFGLLAAAAPGLSAQTLRLRFWGAVPTLPASYLRSTEQRWPGEWDAVVAMDGDELVGWAEYGRYPREPGTADVAACVLDAEQGHGLGTALMTMIVERARDAGLRSVHADIAPHNLAARHAWRHVTGGSSADLPLAS
jgi:RimJ/RimL family protein N-acetyltransferase